MLPSITHRKTINTFYQDFDLERLPGIPAVEDYRTDFQVDRDRVVFSPAFRQLQSKTQVFRSGEYDFYRTRLTHSIEVARIGHSICDFLKATSPLLAEDFFIDPDLVEALGLSHDLGHPPFGHIGERKLNELMQNYGGFEGNAQTLRILTELIYNRENGPQGMSPTRAFLDGILKYKVLQKECIQYSSEGSQGPIFPENHFLYNEQECFRTFALGTNNPISLFKGKHISAKELNNLKSIECQIMDWADDTAYSMHDILDGIKAGFLDEAVIQNWAENKSKLTASQHHALERLFDAMRLGIVEARFSKQIGGFIRACSLREQDEETTLLANKTNRYRYSLEIDPSIQEECSLYQQIAYDLIFESVQMQQVEFKGGRVLDQLFHSFSEHYLNPKNPRPLKILPTQLDQWIFQEKDFSKKARMICDYLSGLTDGFAVRLYKRLFDPEFGSITDLV